MLKKLLMVIMVQPLFLAVTIGPVINHFYTVPDNQPTPTRITGPNCLGVGTVQALDKRNLRSQANLLDSSLFTPRRFLLAGDRLGSVGRDSTCKFFLLETGEWVFNEGLIFTPKTIQTPTVSPVRPTASPTPTCTPQLVSTPVFVRVRVNQANMGILELRQCEEIIVSFERVSP